MKKILFGVVLLTSMVSQNANAQLFKKLKEKINNAATSGAVDNNTSSDSELERVEYETIKQWKPAKDFASSIANNKYKLERMVFDIADYNQRFDAQDAEFNANWSNSTFLFEADNKFFDNSYNRGKANSGTYTLTGNLVETRSNTGGGKKFEVLQKGKNFCFKIQTSKGTGYITVRTIPKTDVEKKDASFASNITRTITSKLNNKNYYIVGGDNALGARNDAYSNTYYYIANKIFRSTYIEEHSYTDDDIIFTEFPVEKIKTETFKAIANSTSTFLEFELDGTYDVENHIQKNGKLTVTKTNKIFSAYVGFRAANSAKNLADLIIKNGSADQKAKYEKIKNNFEKTITALKSAELTDERASNAANNAARENMATITLKNQKGKFDIEEIPAAGNKNCTYQSYTFRGDETQRTITFCIGSTVKIKGGEVLFTVTKAQQNSTYTIR